MFLLDYLDWDKPLATLMSLVFFLLFSVFITLALISAAILLINQLFGWDTYPEEEETHV